MFFKDLLIESGKGVVEGAVIAICLLGADKVSDFITSETRKYLLSKTSEILKAGAHNGIDTIEEVVAQIIQTSINSGTKKTVEAMLAQDFEAEELMGSTWKDIRKKLFKSGLTSIRGKV